MMARTLDAQVEYLVNDVDDRGDNVYLMELSEYLDRFPSSSSGRWSRRSMHTRDVKAVKTMTVEVRMTSMSFSWMRVVATQVPFCAL